MFFVLFSSNGITGCLSLLLLQDHVLATPPLQGVSACVSRDLINKDGALALSIKQA